MPEEGLEPSLPCGNQILSLARLPISPPRHFNNSDVSIRKRRENAREKHLFHKNLLLPKKNIRYNNLYLLVPPLTMIFVHCRCMPWWWLSVLRDIIFSCTQNEQNTDTPWVIYTLFSDTDTLEIGGKIFRCVTPLGTTINAYLSGQKKVFGKTIDYRVIFVLSPLLLAILAYKIARHKPTTVIVSSFAVSKNLFLSSRHTYHLYLHSPMQYVRTHATQYRETLTGWKKYALTRLSPVARFRDKHTNTWNHHWSSITANSQSTTITAQEIYGYTDIKQCIPAVHQAFLGQTTPLDKNQQTQPFCLFVWRIQILIRQTDRIIKACNETQTQLIIIGDGPDRDYCESIAWPTITFLWWCDRDTLISSLSQAHALINIADESFGLGTLESLLIGTPVLGLDAWGSAELVSSDTWILLPNTQHARLTAGIQSIMNTQRDHWDIAAKTKTWYNKKKTVKSYAENIFNKK